MMKYFGILTVSLFLIGSLTGCDNSVPVEDDVTAPQFSENAYRSERNHITVELPSGWAVAEGPEYLANPFDGEVAFNSWGEEDFWAPEITSGDSSSYNPKTIAEQVPAGGAYVVLVRLGGPPLLPPYDETEYDLNSLDELLAGYDARNDGGELLYFYKWGKFFHLDVYCSPDATDTTVAELNDLLTSWRFDENPVGDPEWSVIQARALLPEQAGPLWFKLETGTSRSEDIMRYTEIEFDENTAHIRFVYVWDDVALPQPLPDKIDSDSAHWWKLDVLPDGEAVLVDEGGSKLP